MENTSILEVGDLGVSVESAGYGERLATVGLNLNVLANLELSSLHVNIELFFTRKSMGVSVFTSFELHREDTHTNEVGSMDSLVTLSNDSLHTLEVRSLSSPIAR